VDGIGQFARGLFLLSLATQGACWSSAADYPAAGPVLFTQYAVSEPSDTTSLDCFNACLRWSVRAERQSCMGECEGVIASVTSDPCSPAVTRPCTYDALPPGERGTSYDDDGAGQLLGSAIELLAGAAAAGTHDSAEHSAVSGAHPHPPNHMHAEPTPAKSEHVGAPVEHHVATGQPGAPSRPYHVAEPRPGKKT
jgi:hypothetical protein